MEAAVEENLQCMEVWGGTKPVSRAIEMDGLNVWIYSKPHEEAEGGGDIYFASTCATGRINRLLLADVCGHGRDVAGTAKGLRKLMSRYVNCLDQTTFVKSMNQQFTTSTPDGCFATAVVATYFAPSNGVAVCNAGHPAPLFYNAEEDRWSAIAIDFSEDDPPRNVPLGILEHADYCQAELKLMPGDLLLCYTDALSEARDAAGQMIGGEGLLELVRTLDPTRADALIDRLLLQVARLNPSNLNGDDVTALLMQPAARRTLSFRQRIGGFTRLAGALLRSLNPASARAPMPDLSVANVGGAIFPWLGRRHQPKLK